MDYTRDVVPQFRDTIGEHSYGKIHTQGDTGELHVGKFCSIGPETTVVFGGHRLDWFTTYPFPDNFVSNTWTGAKGLTGQDRLKGGVRIGNDVWIGRNVTILDGVKIGDGAVISACSLITRNVKSYSIVGGNPAQFLAFRFKKEVIDVLKQIKWWDWEPDKINRNLHILCSNDFEKLKTLINE